MNRELTRSFRGRTYSQGSDYLSPGDDSTDNEEKQTMFALLKECGKSYVDHIQITSNHDDEKQIPYCHFEDLVNEGVACISEWIEVLPTSEENDNDSLSEDANDCLSEDDLVNEGFSFMSDGNEVLPTSEENDNDSLSEDANDCLSEDDLVNEGFSCTSVGNEVLQTSQENDKDSLSEDANDQSSTIIECFRCAKVTRVDDGTILKAGNHVKFGRYAPHTKTNTFLKKHLKGSLGFPYYHHAIVTEIHKQSKQKLSFDAVEFTSTYGDDGKTVFKVVETCFKNVYVDDEFMYVVDYKQLSFTADEIVKRARSFKGNKTYDLFTNNCEHFALWCVTNVKASFQSDNTGDAIQNWATWFSAMMAKVSHLTAVSKDIASATKSIFIRVSTATLAASIGCPIVCAIVECILLLRRLRQLKNHLKRRLICLCCYNSKKFKIMAKLVIGFIVSIALLIPTAKYALPVIGFSLLTLVVFPWACEKIITKIKAKINPTSVIPQMIVHSIADIKPGDILSESTRFTTHDVVVEQVKLLPRTVPLSTASLDVVHYVPCGILGTRTVLEEHLNVNLEKEKLFVFDFHEEQTFSPEIVISRAKQRVGEQQFNMFTRRSSHMAWECKVILTNMLKGIICQIVNFCYP